MSEASATLLSKQLLTLMLPHSFLCHWRYCAEPGFIGLEKKVNEIATSVLVIIGHFKEITANSACAENK